MHGARMLISRLERKGNQADTAAPLFMQEWAIEVMVEPPVGLRKRRTDRHSSYWHFTAALVRSFLRRVSVMVHFVAPSSKRRDICMPPL